MRNALSQLWRQGGLALKWKVLSVSCVLVTGTVGFGQLNALGAAPATFGAANTAASTTLSASVSPTGSGDLLVGVFKVRNTTSLATVKSVTDSASQVWSKAASVTQGKQSSMEIWFFANAASVTSITVTVTSASAIALSGFAITGALTTNPLDKTAAASGSSTAASSGATTSTSQPSEIAIGAVGWNGTTATPSGETAGYTTTGIQRSTASGAATGEEAAYQILSGSGTQSYGATLSALASWTAAVATFKLGNPTPPTITSFTPANGPIGTPVTITGTGFTGATSVGVNGTTQTAITVTGDTQIAANVPCGATGTGPITVTTAGGTATSSPTNFAVTAPPTPSITSFSPTSGPIGQQVVIIGSGFTCASAVGFTGASQTALTVNSDTKITTTVPSGATSGTLTVTTPEGISAASSQSFTVVTAPHIMLIVMENREYGSIIGSSSAPYLNSLANTYRSATNWYAVQHNSPNDYLELLAGSNLGLPNGVPYSATTLVDELHTNGIPWHAYMESMPSNCFVGSTTNGLYSKIHNPFQYFTNYNSTQAAGWCSGANLSTEGVFQYPGSGALVSTLDGANPPDFVWITPNNCDNMHGDTNAGSTCASSTTSQLTKAGDTWLSSNIGPVISSSWFSQNGIIIITWDEGSTSLGCCGLTTPGGHIATIVVTSNNKGLGKFTGTGDHYGTLAAIEKAFGVTLLLNSGNSVNGDLGGAF